MNNLILNKRVCLKYIKNFLEEGFEGYYQDLLYEAFEIVDFFKEESLAKSFLDNYGVFKAHEKISNFEENNYGEVYTDTFKNPLNASNMIFYIMGVEVINEIMCNINDESIWDSRIEGKAKKILLKHIEILLSEI